VDRDGISAVPVLLIRPAPVVLEQVWVDETKSAVPARLRRPQYPQLYTTGYVPASGEQSTGANVGQIGDFWAGMNRAARASTIAK
jgi:hypothetical protein